MRWELPVSAVFAAALMSSAVVGQAAITANFTDGNGTTLPDQYAGTSGNGWTSGWTPANSGSVVTIASSTAVITNALPTNQMNGGGNYLQVTVNANNNTVAGNAAFLKRSFDNGTNGISTTNPFTVSFDFRAENLPGSGQSYQMYQTNGSSSAWSLRATSSGNWQVVGGNGSGTAVVSTVSGSAFAINQTYHVVVSVDPANQKWSATISDGTNTYSTGLQLFRAVMTDAGNTLQFGAFTPADSTHSVDYKFDLDNVAVTPVPEAASSMTLLGGTALLFKRYRK